MVLSFETILISILYPFHQLNKTQQKQRGDGDEDDLEDLEWQNSIPSTFGKRSDKLGKPLSDVFGPGYLQRVAGAGPSVGAIGEALQSDDEAKSFVKKYAGNSKVGGWVCAWARGDSLWS